MNENSKNGTYHDTAETLSLDFERDSRRYDRAFFEEDE